VTTGCGHIYVTVNSDEHGICEVFSSLGKTGGCASAQLEATCRLISLALRSGVEPAAIVKHLRGIRCASIAWEEGHAVLSCADAIGGVLEKHLKDEGGGSGNGSSISSSSNIKTASSFTGQCPDCSGLLIYQEGCHHCPGCGYTKC
jgi:ribonucleoside-diphosphate reductase alpha chain